MSQISQSLPIPQSWESTRHWAVYSVHSSHRHRYMIHWLLRIPTPPDYGVGLARRVPLVPWGKWIWPEDGKTFRRDKLEALHPLPPLPTTQVWPPQPGGSYTEEQTGLPSKDGLYIMGFRMTGLVVNFKGLERHHIMHWVLLNSNCIILL